MNSPRERGDLPDGLVFDDVSGELSGPSGETRLAPQPSSLLALLVSRAGDVVGRDEIRRRLWPAGHVDYEQGIAFAVREIRKAIESVGGNPASLETLPRRGFRLRPAETSAARPPSRIPATLAATAIAVLAVAAFVTLATARRATPVIAYFRHDVRAGADSFADRLAAGLTTELTTALEGDAGVVGPTGTGDLAGPDDTEGVRERLGACLIVSGGIEVIADDSVVIFTQIVRATDRVHVWARMDTIDRAAPLAPIVARVTQGAREALPDC